MASNLKLSFAFGQTEVQVEHSEPSTHFNHIEVEAEVEAEYSAFKSLQPRSKWNFKLKLNSRVEVEENKKEAMGRT